MRKTSSVGAETDGGRRKRTEGEEERRRAQEKNETTKITLGAIVLSSFSLLAGLPSN